jgi:hypothetical protein
VTATFGGESDTITGSFTLDPDNLSAGDTVNITVSGFFLQGMYDAPVSLSANSIKAAAPGNAILLIDFASPLSSNGSDAVSDVVFFVNQTSSGFVVVTGDAAVTPLPAALPLFAAGVSGLGLFGWRRKRKAR